jgi:hypothetical protein
VLIGGPTGTGKEVLSRFIHDRSPRAKGPFVAVNCAAMPEAMLEALLFGHTKGAFTGATQASEGFFRAADGGTLLLDEIAEMPLTLQAKLLRTLQEGEVVPIGSTQPIKIDVRIIAAANRDLPTEVAEGRFRADLFYRLNVFPCRCAPCASAWMTSRRWLSPWPCATRPRAPRRCPGSATAPSPCCACTAGRAMSASWRMWCAAPCCWPTPAMLAARTASASRSARSTSISTARPVWWPPRR